MAWLSYLQFGIAEENQRSEPYRNLLESKDFRLNNATVRNLFIEPFQKLAKRYLLQG